MHQLVIALVACAVCADEDGTHQSLRGNWKLVGTLPAVPVGQDSVLVILETAGKKGDWRVKATGIDAFKGTTIKSTSLSRKIFEVSLQGPVPLECVFKLSEVLGDRIPGTFNLRGIWFPCLLEKSIKGTLDGERMEQATPGSDLVETFLKTKPVSERIQLVREILEKHPDSPAGLKASGMMVEQLITEANDKDLKESVEMFEKALNKFPIQLVVGLMKNQILTMCKKQWQPHVAARMLEFLKMETEGVPDALFTRDILRMESKVYPLVGKPEQAQKAGMKLDAIERQLDEDFEKNSVPFVVEKKSLPGFFPKSPAVVELFTGAQCPPCVAADVAFDALGKSYSHGDLLLLQYHLHIPGPDPLTNSLSEARARYYGVRSTPSVFLNGQEGPPVGGPKMAGNSRFVALTNVLNGMSRSKAHEAISLQLALDRSAEEHAVSAKFSGVTEHRKCLLRLFLVEETVRYPGRNGQRLHHQVVRAPVGDPKGIVLGGTDGHLKILLGITKIREETEKYWEQFEKRRPFLDDERPLDLEKLAIVSILQDIESKEIIQAARIPLK